MSHSSQITMNEYTDKHQPQNTKKLANLWEEKMGGDKIHSSPVSSVSSPMKTVRNTQPIPTAEPIQAEDALQKKKTKDIISNFERMASSDESIPTPVTVSASVSAPKKTADDADVSQQLDRVASCLADLNKAVDDLRCRMKQM